VITNLRAAQHAAGEHKVYPTPQGERGDSSSNSSGCAGGALRVEELEAEAVAPPVSMRSTHPESRSTVA